MKRSRIFAALLATLAASVLLSGMPQPAAVPRPEHPQPQFQREAWLNLNGPWQFEFDDKNVGLSEGWERGDRALGRTITVPYCFESRASGIGDTSFHPVVWYRKTVTLPDAWKGRRVLLNFGAVDYMARVWVNGRGVGEHVGGNVPFRFDVTPYLQPGANQVVVRAEDPPTDRYIPRGKQYWEPKSRSIFYTRTSGIWQTVWLEATGESYLERAAFDPRNDGILRIDARIARLQPGLDLSVVVKSGENVIATAVNRADASRTVTSVAVPNPRLWSPGSPNLYDLVLELRRGDTVVDRVTSYFGFRSVAVENGRVRVNGRPIFLKLVLDQGYWPESILTPPTDEAIQFDIRMTKEMGFNGARKHQKVEDPRFLYWADKMGFLVSGEMANAYLFDDTYVARFTQEWVEAVERDRNHPSVVIWAPLNESWGTPDLRDPRQQAHLRALYTLTKSLDPTRPVIDNEGWGHTDMTDLFALHDYAKTGDVLLERYKDLGKPDAVIPPGAGVDVLVPGARYNGSPFYLSEFGGIAFIPPGHEVPKEAWGYAGVEKTAESALERMRSLWSAIARTPAWAGLCYTQITDVEQEVNGLMTYDRKMKFDPKAVREINALVR